MPLARTKGMLGLRFTFHTKEQQKFLTSGAADWLWPAAEAAGVPLMVHPPHSLPLIDAIAERHPNLRLVIDHLGLDAAQRRPRGLCPFVRRCSPWPSARTSR